MNEIQKIEGILTKIKQNQKNRNILNNFCISFDKLDLYLKEKGFIFRDGMSYIELRKNFNNKTDKSKLLKLKRYNIISDSSLFIEDKQDKNIYYDFQIKHKHTFIIGDKKKIDFSLQIINESIRLENINKIEDLIEIIDNIGFRKIYNRVDISNKYKINEIELFVKYIYNSKKIENIKKLNLIIKESINKKTIVKNITISLITRKIKRGKDEICTLTKSEIKIIKKLKPFIKEGGMNKENLKLKPTQSIKALEKMINTLKKKLKDHKIQKFIFIEYIRSEKVYNLIGSMYIKNT